MRQFYLAIKDSDYDTAGSLFARDYYKTGYKDMEDDIIRLGELVSYNKNSWGISGTLLFNFEYIYMKYEVQYSKHWTHEEITLKKSENGIYEITERIVDIVK